MAQHVFVRDQEGSIYKLPTEKLHLFLEEHYFMTSTAAASDANPYDPTMYDNMRLCEDYFQNNMKEFWAGNETPKNYAVDYFTWNYQQILDDAESRMTEMEKLEPVF